MADLRLVRLGPPQLHLPAGADVTAPEAVDFVQREAAVAIVALAVDEHVGDWVTLRESDNGFEADPRDLARLAVQALVDAGWRPPATEQPAEVLTQWAVRWSNHHVEPRRSEADACRLARQYPCDVDAVVARTVTHSRWSPA